MILGEKIGLCRAHNKQVLKNLYFSCSAGRTSVFIGASGAGKTSALRVIAGLENNFTGLLSANEKDARALDAKSRAETIGYVAQNYNLFPHLSALANCTLALKSSL